MEDKWIKSALALWEQGSVYLSSGEKGRLVNHLYEEIELLKKEIEGLKNG